jgi:hypothetical protein
MHAICHVNLIILDFIILIILAKIVSYEAPRYALFSNFLLLFRPNILDSILFLKPSFCVLPLM